jgi:phosphatidylserine decarboxylase
MNEKISNTYYDRYRRMFREERIYASGFLYWMYNSRLGQMATELVIKRKMVSSLFGWIHRQQWSRRKIKSFVENMEVATEELPCLPEAYPTFNDFFVREIDRSLRPIRKEPHLCIAPVDGKVLVYPSINKKETFRVKRSSFNLETFVRDAGLVERFSGGSMAVSRLSLRDYHQFHFPDQGIPAEAVSIQGTYHAGGPYAIHRLIPFFAENYRVSTIFESDHFGMILIVEIGALTVGSIRQTYQPGLHVTKGAPKGFFELGSTVVLLFVKGAIEFDEDLRRNTEGDFETYVHYGDSIGSIPGSEEGHPEFVGGTGSALPSPGPMGGDAGLGKGLQPLDL